MESYQGRPIVLAAVIFSLCAMALGNSREETEWCNNQIKNAGRYGLAYDRIIGDCDGAIEVITLLQGSE